MKKIIFIAGITTVFTSLLFVLFGKLDIVTFGGLNTTVLGLLYGWYERVERKEVEADHTLTLMQLEDRNIDYKKLLTESIFLQNTTNSLYEENVKLTEKLKETIPTDTVVVQNKTRTKKVTKK